MDKLQQALNNFNNLWKQYQNYGTMDSEPLYIRTQLLNQILQLKNTKIPNTPEEWQIYSSKKDSKKVANSLHNSLQKLVNTLLASSVKDFMDFKEQFDF